MPNNPGTPAYTSTQLVWVWVPPLDYTHFPNATMFEHFARAWIRQTMPHELNYTGPESSRPYITGVTLVSAGDGSGWVLVSVEVFHPEVPAP